MRKNILRTFAAALIISSFLVVPAYAESATVIGSGVNFRSGPGMNYYVIASLDSGTPVNVTDRSNSSWYAVTFGGYDGFISSAYLKFDGSSASSPSSTVPAPSVSAGSSNGYINAMYVRFRSGPGSSYSVLGEYNKGKELSIVGSGDGWTSCIIDGQLGYVYSQYVTSGSGSQGSAGGVSFVTPAATPQPSYNIPQPDESNNNGGVSFITPDTTPAPTQAPTPTPSPAATAAPADSSVPSGAVSGYINGTYVRFRSGPGTNHSILGTYNTGKELYVTGSAGNGWYQCYIDGVTGYVHGNYVITYTQASFTPGSGSSDGNLTVGGQQPSVTPTPAPSSAAQYTDAYIAGNNVRVRSAPSMTASILGELFYGNQVKLIIAHDGWAQIMVNGNVGYVASQYVKEGTYVSGGSSDSGAISSPSSSGSSATGQDIVNYALQFVGYNYCWGGASPNSGFDCSGLVYYVYKQFGFTLNRVAADQARNGRHIEASELQPGDLLCFYSGSSYIGHIGIYIGNGQFVHASNSTTGVIISDFSGYYVTRGFEARRIIG